MFIRLDMKIIFLCYEFFHVSVFFKQMHTLTVDSSTVNLCVILVFLLLDIFAGLDKT